MPSPPQAGDEIVVPVFTAESESASFQIQWSQNFKTKSAKFYLVKAKNQTQENDDVLFYIQDHFYNDESSSDFIGKTPGARREGDNFVVKLDGHFQYGQKNKHGENRFVVLHNKGDKPYQHRFLVTTVQSQVAGWAKTFANTFGAGHLTDNVFKMGDSHVGDYLHDF